MNQTFDQLNLDPLLIKALADEKISEPSPVQSRAIPVALLGRDLVVQSETGSGKTLAYLLPLFEKFKQVQRENKVIILAPTHELVIQIQRQIERLSKNSGLGITSTPLIGNANITRQIDKLKNKPVILAGSPGRVLELLKKNKIKGATVQVVVVDEADRLMDDQNRSDVLSVIKSVSPDKQLLFYSASISKKNIDKIKEVSPAVSVIQITESLSIPETVAHFCLQADQQEKIEMVRKLVSALKPERALIFLNKSDQIENLVTKLRYHHYEVDSIHGTSRKLERQKAIEDFKAGRLKLLIASDIAARGLQIEGITHVIHMDVPEDPKEYLHRAGRTGRNQKVGVSIAIVTTTEIPLLKKIERVFSIKFLIKDLFKGNLVDKTDS